MKKIFFAHGIDGLTDEEIINNTQKITALLRKLDFKVISGHTNNNLIPKGCSSQEKNKIIVDNDLNDLKKCELLLVDYSIPNRNYVGCTFEMAYAFNWGKRIIVYVGDSGNEDRIFLQYHATHICKDLEKLRNLLIEYRYFVQPLKEVYSKDYKGRSKPAKERSTSSHQKRATSSV